MKFAYDNMRVIYSIMFNEMTLSISDIIMNNKSIFKGKRPLIICSGNEFLVNKTGLTGGTSILLNSGSMSSSNGPNKGRSKAEGKAWAWLSTDIPLAIAVDFGPPWTAIDVKFITLSRLPIVMMLAQGTEDKFWVRSFLI